MLCEYKDNRDEVFLSLGQGLQMGNVLYSRGNEAAIFC